MKLFSKIKFGKFKKFFKSTPRTLAEHSFLTIVALFFLSLILGGFIFYKYCILVEKAELPIIEKPLQFEQNLYQKILDEWLEREKRFKETDLKEYPDPLKGLTPVPAEELTR